MRIKFKEKTGFDSLGRNGYVRTTGVEVTRHGSTQEFGSFVWIEPITSRGETSEACRIVIPVNAIDAVVEALRVAQCETQLERLILEGAILRRELTWPSGQEGTAEWKRTTERLAQIEAGIAELRGE